MCPIFYIMVVGIWSLDMHGYKGITWIQKWQTSHIKNDAKMKIPNLLSTCIIIFNPQHIEGAGGPPGDGIGGSEDHGGPYDVRWWRLKWTLPSMAHKFSLKQVHCLSKGCKPRVWWLMGEGRGEKGGVLCVVHQVVPTSGGPHVGTRELPPLLPSFFSLWVVRCMVYPKVQSIKRVQTQGQVTNGRG